MKWSSLQKSIVNLCQNSFMRLTTGPSNSQCYETFFSSFSKSNLECLSLSGLFGLDWYWQVIWEHPRCQFHQHFKSSFCAKIILPKNYKPKLKANKSCAENFCMTFNFTNILVKGFWRKSCS